MNKKEITKIILILKTAYPYAFKDMSEEDITNMVELYEEMFKENNYGEVSSAIKFLINTCDYMPSIAMIKTKIYDLTHSQQESNSELWDKLLIAIGNGSYHSEEEFEKLPLLVKEYIKSPSDEIHTVVKGQFLKQIEIIKQNFKENEIMGKGNLLVDKGYVQLEEVID